MKIYFNLKQSRLIEFSLIRFKLVSSRGTLCVVEVILQK